VFYFVCQKIKKTEIKDISLALLQSRVLWPKLLYKCDSSGKMAVRYRKCTTVLDVRKSEPEYDN